MPALCSPRVAPNETALAVDDAKFVLRIRVTQRRLTEQLGDLDPFVGWDNVLDHPAVRTEHHLRTNAEDDEPKGSDRSIQSRPTPHAAPFVIGLDDRTLLERQKRDRNIGGEERRPVVASRVVDHGAGRVSQRKRRAVCGPTKPDVDLGASTNQHQPDTQTNRAATPFRQRERIDSKHWSAEHRQHKQWKDGSPSSRSMNGRNMVSLSD